MAFVFHCIIVFTYFDIKITRQMPYPNTHTCGLGDLKRMHATGSKCARLSQVLKCQSAVPLTHTSVCLPVREVSVTDTEAF